MLVDGPAHGGVRLVIQGAGTVVQDQHFRLSRQSPRHQQPLLLAAGEVGPLDGGGVVQSFRQGIHIFQGHGVPQGGADILLG